MSDTRLINLIRERRGELWDYLTPELKREFIMSLDGDDWRIDELLADFVEARTK